MAAEPQLRTERLLLRRWRSSDLESLAALNADPVVMEHFPDTLSRAQSASLIERIERCFDEHGFGLWAVELPWQEPPIGFVGLAPVDIDVAFAPSVELGWRLARPFWKQGLASEAAAGAIDFAFDQLGLRELVSYTAACNVRSRQVMERLGMARDAAGDFLHPGLPAAHRLALHVLYRLDAQRWRISSKRCAGATPTPRASKN
ncbi:MAG TPA: GNAT family N-acetyltransferase [Solirubrobacteraceae bacterium]|nr:GNAT family N-acetyltransferase [Solirubrobacteraceae bacterium]